MTIACDTQSTQIECRIGIANGQVLAGMLGKLQVAHFVIAISHKRFVMRGMRRVTTNRSPTGKCWRGHLGSCGWRGGGSGILGKLRVAGWRVRGLIPELTFFFFEVMCERSRVEGVGCMVVS